MARPRLTSGKARQVNIKMPDELVGDIEAAARQAGRTRAGWIRWACREAIKPKAERATPA